MLFFVFIGVFFLIYLISVWNIRQENKNEMNNQMIILKKKNKLIIDYEHELNFFN